jgi:transposase
MSLQWLLDRVVPEDTAKLGQQLFSVTQAYRVLGDRFDELFPEEQVFAELYATTGRGAMPPLLMALVTVFQFLEKVPDRTAAAMVVSRIDWKYALHLPLGYSGFHFTDLYAFRVRLYEHQEERLVFEQLLAKLKALGLINAHGKVRTDATHILAVAQRLTQLELVSESLRLALQAAQAVAPAWVEANLTAAFREAYGERESEYGLSSEKVRSKLLQVSRDGYAFLTQLEAQTTPEAVQQLSEVGVLRTVLQQQFPQGPGTPPAQRPTGHDIIETPHEPEARYAVKRGHDYVGFKVQVSETCDAELPPLIVDLEPTNALENDAPHLPAIQQRLAQQGVLPAEQQVDQGYMSGENLVKSAEQGIALLGVPLNDTQGPAGFKQAAFQIDPLRQQAICPQGQVSATWSSRTPQTANTPAPTQVRFAAQVCQSCPAFGLCTSSGQGRSLTLHPYRLALEARRAEAQTEPFRQRLHLRAGIEGTISELVRAHRLRFARYRGQAKLRLQAYFTAVAVNLKRLARWLTASGMAPSAGAAC